LSSKRRKGKKKKEGEKRKRGTGFVRLVFVVLLDEFLGLLERSKKEGKKGKTPGGLDQYDFPRVAHHGAK